MINNALRNLLQKPFLNNTNIFNEIDPDFLEIIKTIKPSEKKLIKLNLKDELLQLAVQASEFKLKNNYYKLISLQNIKVELEEKELEAFHKLIRVLTHEIMNSVTPITSLTSSIHEIFNIKKVKSSDIDEKTVTYISDGLEAILDRSTGLLNFTQAYQKLTRIPPPKFTKINTSELFERIKILFNPEMIENKIEFSVSINTNAKALLADTELLAQVIINLIKNSIEAVLKIKQAKIIVTIERSNEGKTIICIEDNGIGIPEEEMEKIFIPFYTTKENGSGIGLSLSRQILRLHKGSIMVNSVPGSKTIFTLKF